MNLGYDSRNRRSRPSTDDPTEQARGRIVGFDPAPGGDPEIKTEPEPEATTDATALRSSGCTETSGSSIRSSWCPLRQSLRPLVVEAFAAALG